MSRESRQPSSHAPKPGARPATRGSSDRWFHPLLEALEDRVLLSVTPSTIVGQYVFYDQSAFDGNIAGVNAGDDAAIATDKSAFIPGAGLSGFQNVTSYVKGLNGLMIDLKGDGSHASINASDFVFKSGADNTPGAWPAAPSPTTISVRPGAGVSGSDRVEIIWGGGAVKNHWLEVQVLATAHTGLATTTSFFWGNKVGDTGSPSATDFNTTVSGDGGLIVNGLGAGAGITNVRDIDRSNSVTIAGDRGLVIANLGTLNRLTIEGAPPALQLALANDTGPGGVPNNDGITTDPTITGTLIAANGLANFHAGITGSSLPLLGGPNAPAVVIDWVPVANPGNVGQFSGADAKNGGGVDAIVGAVNYSYQIGKYDVTNSQYAAFLNAKDPTGANALSLYNSSMGTDLANGGIAFNAAAPSGSKFSVMPGRGNYPVTYTTWFDAIRFANWLNNGQGNGDTETGAYTLASGGNLGVGIQRHADANVFLPSEDEWYKSAYYNPATDSYYQFPTSSNALPGYGPPPADNNSANYVPGGNPGAHPELSVGHVTAVGAYTTTVSPYGAYDEGGNVLQWTDTAITAPSGPTRAQRGGSYLYVSDHMLGAYRDGSNPNAEASNTGFRVASAIAPFDVLSLVQPDGTVTLSSSILAAMAGGPLPDGMYTLHFTATDAHHLSTTLDVPFTLKRSVATPKLPDLSPFSDSGPSNTDNITNTNTLTIWVVAEIGATVQIFVDGAVLDEQVAHSVTIFNLPRLTDGAHVIRARSVDIAGNESALSPMLRVTILVDQPTVSIDWVTVGDPGNVGQLSGSSQSGGGGVDAVVGAVNYSYLIDKYDVTNSQYTAFLNGVDPSGANLLDLYDSRMGTDLDNGGIAFSAGAANGSKFSVMPGRGNYPVTFASWFDSIRFANWLNNGQGDGDTETGAYTIAAGGNLGVGIHRNADAKVFLPSEDEWFKAAYYNAATASYFIFPTSSNTLPGYGPPPADNNSVNYVPGGNPGMRFDLSVGHVTAVGAYTTTVGPYGTYDQGGNVSQWNEALINSSIGVTRGARGGSFNEVWDHMSAAYRGSFNPTVEGSNTSFRVASIIPPAPAAVPAQAASAGDVRAGGPSATLTASVVAAVSIDAEPAGSALDQNPIASSLASLSQPSTGLPLSAPRANASDGPAFSGQRVDAVFATDEDVPWSGLDPMADHDSLAPDSQLAAIGFALDSLADEQLA